MAARPEISITVPQTPSPANKTEDEKEAALSEMAGLFVLWLAQGCGRCRIASRGIKTGAEMQGRAQRSGTEGMREGIFVVISTSSPINEMNPKS